MCQCEIKTIVIVPEEEIFLDHNPYHNPYPQYSQIINKN